MIALTDSVVRDVLIGVVGNGLWSLVVRSGATITKEVRGVVSPPEPTVLKAVRTAADELLESLPDGQERARGRLVGYLKSPELESIVRQLFATSLVGTTKESTTSTIKAEFVSALSMHLDVGESRLEPFATSFFATLVSSVEGALQAAIEKNILPAHEAKSAARHRMLLDEISNLKKNLAFLNSEPSLNIDSILKFEAEYRGMVGSVHSHIKPPHLESGRRVPIDEIFVAPLISYVPRLKAEQPETLPLPVFLSRLYRAVLLGNPGGGKSTVSAKICYDLATRYEDRLFAGREITPVVVTLREYGTQKKATNCSIVQFLAQQASSRYQLEPPPLRFRVPFA